MLSQDRVANVYALTDLEPPYESYTTVAVAQDDQGGTAACLVVRHPAFTGVVTHGNSDGVRLLLASIELPKETFLDVPAAHRPVFEQRFVFTDPHERLLMAVRPDTLYSASVTAAAPVRLGPADLEDLIDLYAGYEASAFHPAQLEYGVFCGIREGARLVAAGGTPGLALRSATAVVTSVFTRPEARRRGFGAAITGAVTEALFALGCDIVSLDVEVDNLAARRIYERLGYQAHSIRLQGAAMLR